MLPKEGYVMDDTVFWRKSALPYLNFLARWTAKILSHLFDFEKQSCGVVTCRGNSLNSALTGWFWTVTIEDVGERLPLALSPSRRTGKAQDIRQARLPQDRMIKAITVTENSMLPPAPGKRKASDDANPLNAAIKKRREVCNRPVQPFLLSRSDFHY